MVVASKGLFRETIIYSIGAFGSKVLKFLLVPLYTFFLTKKEMGEYDLFLTTITLIVPLASFQISDAIYRWLISAEIEQNKSLKDKIIFNSLIAYLSAFLIFTVLFYFFLLFEDFPYSQYFVICLFFATLLPLLQNMIRGLGKIKEYAANGIITSTFLIFLNILFIWILEFKVVGILLANIFSNALVVLLIIFRLRLYSSFNLKLFDRSLINKMLQYSLPLIPNLMSWWLISSASKFIILDKLGVDANGIYAISSRFPSILIIVNSIFILPIQDLFLKEKSNFEYFTRLLKKFIVLEFSLVLLLSLGAPIYTKFFVSSDFYIAWEYMPFLYLGVGFNTIAALISIVYQKEKRTERIMVTTILGGMVSILTCFFSISYFQLKGVSFTFFLGYLTMFLFRYYDIKINSDFKLSFNLKKLILFLLFFSCSVLIMYWSAFIWQIILFLLSSIIIGYINRSFISEKFKNYVIRNTKSI